MPCLCISISSFFSLYFSPFLTTALKKMHVCPAHTHRSYCLLYLHIASEQSRSSRRANRWQDGEQRDGEGRQSQRSTFFCLARQKDERMEVEGRWYGEDLCPSLHIVFTETDTTPAHSDISFSNCSNGCRHAGRWKDKEASVQIVVFMPWLLSLCTLKSGGGSLCISVR